ncbi:MAG: hypothetical protein PHN64_05815 [Desulfovibrionaceae bacterium]|nr:hypothetical protein [Desulfovibrionaceae bacterium]
MENLVLYWQQALAAYASIMEHYPFVHTTLALLAVVLPLAALLAFPGLALMAITGQLLAIKRKRSFYDKGAKQLALLATLLGWLLSTGGAVWLLCRYTPQTIPLDAIPLQVMVHCLAWLLITLGAFFASLHYSLWKGLKQYPRMHQFIGLFALVSAYLGAYTLMASLVLQSQLDAGLVVENIQQALVPAENSPLWNAVYYLPVLVAAMAGGLGSLWFVVRRKRDDFGRDHYNTVVPWAACWARNAWLCLWLILLFFTGWEVITAAQEHDILPQQELLNHALRLALWLIPLLLWCIVTRSATPLRHKFTLLLAQILVMGFLIPFSTGLSWGY